MGIKNIIRESLLNEIGEANTKPYMWKLVAEKPEHYIYEFTTMGGSNLLIRVTFWNVRPTMMIGLVDSDRRLPSEAINLVKANPYNYWDIEFAIDDDRGSALEDPYLTISKSEFKSDNIELFRILATLNKIILDLLSREKVRGLTFKPASKKRGNIFLKYFIKNMPSAQKIITYEGVHIIILDKNLKSVDTKLKPQSPLSRKLFGKHEY